MCIEIGLSMRKMIYGIIINRKQYIFLNNPRNESYYAAVLTNLFS